MSEHSWDRVRPLVDQRETLGNRLLVVFRCPLTRLGVETSATLGGPGRATDVLPGNSPRVAMRGSLARALRFFAWGDRATAPEDVQDGEQAAALRAFLRVEDQFEWDPAGGRYVGSQRMMDLQTEFSRILAATRLRRSEDRQILARMVNEIATGDDHVQESERNLAASVLGRDGPAVEVVQALPPLSDRELSSVAPELREPMLMAAYAVAYADHELQRPEMDRLLDYARGMDLDPAVAARLAAYARQHVMDRVLYAAWREQEVREPDADPIWEAARRLGIDLPTLRRIEARFQRRHGPEPETF